MPSSPDECTATPSWKVSQTPAAFTHGADTAPEGRVQQYHVDPAVQHVRGQLLEIHDNRVGGERNAQLLTGVPHAGEPEDGILEIVVVEILDGPSESDGLFGRPDGIGIESHGIAWDCRGDGTVALEIVVGRKHPALQFVRSEPVFLLELARVFYELIGRAHGATPIGGGIAIEQVRRERDAVANASAEDVAHRYTPRLAQKIQAGELERRDDLRAVVVERGRRVGEQEAHLLEARRVAPEQIRLHRVHGRDRRFSAPAELAEPDEPGIGLDLDDGANESAPVAAVGMAKRRFEGHGDSRGADVGDPHRAKNLPRATCHVLRATCEPPPPLKLRRGRPTPRAHEPTSHEPPPPLKLRRGRPTSHEQRVS